MAKSASKKSSKLAPKPAKRNVAGMGKKASKPMRERRLGTVSTDPPPSGV